jgi:hypothetical protein
MRLLAGRLKATMAFSLSLKHLRNLTLSTIVQGRVWLERASFSHAGRIKHTHVQYTRFFGGNTETSFVSVRIFTGR